MTIIFGIYNQPRKTTRYTKKFKLVWGGGGNKKEPLFGIKNSKNYKKIEKYYTKNWKMLKI